MNKKGPGMAHFFKKKNIEIVFPELTVALDEMIDGPEETAQFILKKFLEFVKNWNSLKHVLAGNGLLSFNLCVFKLYIICSSINDFLHLKVWFPYSNCIVCNAFCSDQYNKNIEIVAFSRTDNPLNSFFSKIIDTKKIGSSIDKSSKVLRLRLLLSRQRG